MGEEGDQGRGSRGRGGEALGSPREPGPALPRLSPWPVPARLLLWDVEGVVTRATRKTHADFLTQTWTLGEVDRARRAGPDLFLQRHDEDAPDLEEALHVVLVLLLHAGPAVHPVVLRTARGELQAVARNEGRFTEVKPGRMGFHDETDHTVSRLHSTSALTAVLMCRDRGWKPDFPEADH